MMKKEADIWLRERSELRLHHSEFIV